MVVLFFIIVLHLTTSAPRKCIIQTETLCALTVEWNKVNGIIVDLIVVAGLIEFNKTVCYMHGVSYY